MIPTTTERVLKSTDKHLNDCISEKTRLNVTRYAASSPKMLDQRLRELDHEWDVERVTATGVGLGLVAGGALTLLFGVAWAAVPLTFAACLLMHAFLGWSPFMPMARSMGFRTNCEIAHERYALKALRGDFHRLAAVTTPQDREDLARFEDEGGPPAPETCFDASDPEIVNEAIRAVRA